jgi:hypothetical protein
MPAFFSEFERDELQESVDPACLDCEWLDKRGNCRRRKCTQEAV